jgi:hypothetical protein
LEESRWWIRGTFELAFRTERWRWNLTQWEIKRSLRSHQHLPPWYPPGRPTSSTYHKGLRPSSPSPSRSRTPVTHTGGSAERCVTPPIRPASRSPSAQRGLLPHQAHRLGHQPPNSISKTVETMEALYRELQKWRMM